MTTCYMYYIVAVNMSKNCELCCSEQWIWTVKRVFIDFLRRNLKKRNLRASLNSGIHDAVNL